MRPPRSGPPPEALGVLVLPRRLEQFELAGHARGLLAIPRVVAVEPSSRRANSLFWREMLSLRQARRLKFPGAPRVVVLYGPRQYYLGRALAAHHEAELWYVEVEGDSQSADPEEQSELKTLDELARDLAQGVLTPSPEGEDTEPLRRRMIELEIISSRPFVPGARIDTR